MKNNWHPSIEHFFKICFIMAKCERIFGLRLFFKSRLALFVFDSAIETVQSVPISHFEKNGLTVLHFPKCFHASRVVRVNAENKQLEKTITINAENTTSQTFLSRVGIISCCVLCWHSVLTECRLTSTSNIIRITIFYML